MEELRLSALFGEHIAARAAMTPFAGWNMPLRYTSDREGHRAVRESAGKFDSSHMGQVEVEGLQTAAVLDYSLCTKPFTMPAGRARHSVMLTPDGGIIDNLTAYRLEEARCPVVPNGVNRITVVEELTQRGRERCVRSEASEDHSVVDRTLGRALIAVQGSESLEAVVTLLGPEDAERVVTLGYYRALEAKVDGAPAMIAQTGYTGETGYEIMLPASTVPDVWRKIEAKACGLASHNTLHLKAGMPLYDNELGRDVTPADAGTARLLASHEFIGGAALTECKPTWDLYALVGEGRRAARVGNTTMSEGREVGKVTSGALSSTLGYPIALARLEPGIVKGAVLDVNMRGTLQPMRVASFPFYKRPRRILKRLGESSSGPGGRMPSRRAAVRKSIRPTINPFR